MTYPIDVQVDLAHGYGHVRFREPRDGESVGSSFVQDPNGDDLDVILERADNGDVIGIEVMNLADVTLAAAQTVAGTHDLAFPIETFHAALREASVTA